MPELPDVQVMREYLDATSLHRKIRAVRISRERDILDGVSRRRLTDELEGAKLEKTHRHGKYLFARLSSGGWLMLHFGMTGYLDFAKDDDLPEHWRLLLSFDRGRRLAYVCRRLLGKVSLVDEPATLIEKVGLGPDALSDDLDRETFEERVIERRGKAKSTLMNQGVIAGIGNVYSDEILFHARVHPGRAMGGLGSKERSALYREMKRVLRKAIECRADSEKMPRSWITPRRGDDGRCPVCGGSLEQVKISGRTAYLCAKRQRKS